MVKPEVRKRFVDSIDYLRKMGFFQEYSNLSSEEILNKIFRGEITYKFHWEKEPDRWRGRYLKDSLEEYEGSWMRASDNQIDYEIIPFDTKRVVCEKPETIVEEDIGVTFLKRYAEISRGVFQPKNISSRWLTPLGSKWLIQEVSFDFKGKRYSIEIAIQYDWLIDLGLRELNELIEDTGYQYYRLHGQYLDYIIIVVLTKDEAEKLERERGWGFKYLTEWL